MAQTLKHRRPAPLETFDRDPGACCCAPCFRAPRPGESFASACTPPVVNAVACENTLPGTPQSDWDVERQRGRDDPGLRDVDERRTSARRSAFKIKSPTRTYTSTSYRLGYYGGDGARLIAGRTCRRPGPTDPAGLPDVRRHRPDRLRQLVGDSLPGRCRAPPSPASTSRTWSRNDTGGDEPDHRSSSATTPATRTSSSRPRTRPGRRTTTTAATASTSAPSPARPAIRYALQGRVQGLLQPPAQPRLRLRTRCFAGAEYPMIRFLEANGYDVSYISGVDVNRDRGRCCSTTSSSSPAATTSTGRRRSARAMEDARDAGVNLAFFSGNEGFWKTRWEPSTDGTNTPTARSSPTRTRTSPSRQDPVEWTGTWRDPRFTPAGRERHAGERADRAVVHRQLRHEPDHGALRSTDKLRLWRNTAVASLTPGQRVTLAPDTLGYEWDVDPTTASAPPARSGCRRRP